MPCEHCPADVGGYPICWTPLEKLREGHRKTIERLNDNANRRTLAIQAIMDGDYDLALRILTEAK